jgi:hypothetical protein
MRQLNLNKRRTYHDKPVLEPFDKYWYFWFVEKPGGRLFLKFEDGSTTSININDDVRFQGIVDTLRNEKRAIGILPIPL